MRCAAVCEMEAKYFFSQKFSANFVPPYGSKRLSVKVGGREDIKRHIYC